ncbi:hypothetical protein K438DRAFT_108201 [Mycena galopus ATCC 62051]|nr:hypothetical protein K438DRAFT_108201 [Mycena galopus ATCC 62051]
MHTRHAHAYSSRSTLASLAHPHPLPPAACCTPPIAHTHARRMPVAPTHVARTNPSRTHSPRACTSLHLLCPCKPVAHTYSCRSPRRLHAHRTPRTAAIPVAATRRARKPVTRTPAAHTRPSPPTHELDAPPASRSCQPDAALTGLRVRQVEPLVAVEVATRRGHSPAPLSASSSDYLHLGCPSFVALTLSLVISTYGLTYIFLTLSSSFYLFPFLYSLRVLVVYRNYSYLKQMD